jgi:wobble nucleotide-excising tRNase
MTTIKKLVSLKSLGRFKNYSATGNVELNKLNLVYAENGKGKTTVCAMFRSLANGDPEPILGRKSLGQSNDPDVHILLSAGQVTFKNGQWSQTLGQMEVFDHTYISENVYSGERVGADQRRNLYRVIVGQQGVQLARDLDKINDDGRALQGDLRQKRKTLEASLGDIKLDDFLSYRAPPDLDDQISVAEKAQQNAQDAGQLKSTPGLTPLTIPVPVSDLTGILGKSIDGVSSDVERAVKHHLLEHGMKAGDQDWLSKGMGFELDAGCPFCGQSLQGVTLIQSFKDLFSKAYKDLKQEITLEGQGLAQSFGDGTITQLQNTFEKNATQHAFWGTKLTLPDLPSLDIEHVKDALIQYREKTLAILRSKVSAPLEAMVVPSDVSAAAAALGQVATAVKGYNAGVVAANQKIDQLKAGLAKADVAAAQKAVKRLHTLKTRADAKIAAICDDIIKLEKEKTALEIKREDVKKKLGAYGDKFTKAYQKRINAYLDKFGASFRITDVDHNYVGGVNAKYDLVINGVSVPLGDEGTPLSQPSFRNTLSAGDKSTLALALFLSQLDEDANPGQKIVVFDDPFSSQDRFRRTQTQLEIVTRATEAVQTFVFSHDAQFLVDLEEKAKGLAMKSLRVSPVGDEHSTIAECDLSDLCKPSQLAMIESMMRYRQNGTQSGHKPEDVVQKLRPVLEAHCSNTCPTSFAAADNLGGMVGIVRSKGEAHPLHPILKDLHEINEYSKKHHHDDGTVKGPVDETELMTFTRRTLRIVAAL